MNQLKKKAQVVMLPTEKAENFPILKNVNGRGDNLYKPTKDYYYTQSYLKKEQFEAQHLYFTIDERPKSGEWFIMNGCILRQCNHIKLQGGIEMIVDTVGGEHHNSVCKKVIATTDEDISIERDVLSINQGRFYNHYPTEKRVLYQPSKSFIQKFISEYNKGNIIKEVMVDYEITPMGNVVIEYGANKEDVMSLKVDKNNCITITRIKDSWSREEVKSLLWKLANGLIGNTINANDQDTEKWIEQNL